MEEVEQNLDGYRVLADVLHTLRRLVQEALDARFSNDWHRRPEFSEVVDRLIERKEREKAIDWYTTEYQDLIDFATFRDLLEILEAEPDLLPQIKLLVPSPHLLHARMLELEALRNKIAMARSITDGELSFLATFHQRFRRTLEKIDPSGSGTPDSGQPAIVQDDEVERGTQPVDPEDSVPEVPSVPPPAVQPNRPAESAPTAHPGQHAGAAAAVEEAYDKKAQDDEETVTGSSSIKKAIEEGDTATVLHFLYREVTGIADRLFSTGDNSSPIYWDMVRTSDWYESNFSRLGLEPLSNFYSIVDQATSLRESGTDQAKVQEFLKEHNFARVLLSLRDMFQKNRA